MAVTYYPGETAKMKTHVVEQLQQPNVLYSVFGTQSLADGPLSVGVWCPKGWEVKRVSINFSGAAAKDYSISVARGIGVVTGKNDRLWVKVNTVSAQQIIIPQGFYTGTTLAAALVTALGLGNFPSASKPFGVSYNAGTGLFTITPAAGNSQLLVSNTTTSVRRISTAAPLIGFTANTANTTPLTSNVPVKGVGTEFVCLSGVDSTSLNVISTDALSMTVDNQLLIQSSSDEANLATYEVVYKVLDA